MKLSLKAKLFLLCIGLCSLAVVVGGISFRGLNAVEATSEHITEDVVPKLELINAMALDYRKIRIHVRTLGIQGLSSSQGDKAIGEAKQAIADYEAKSEAFLKFELSENEKVNYQNLLS